ncbi:unnamed protein product [Angiostrongylus costaricensis]|uniref:Uncharacterized protein n=1 Tax=Angiostrongylus costaricensis TaxID=334426 RepID=A0A0R3PT70_ANGCS|nr:unnamed protein product [Angiostrongylus costaricensis]
MLDELRESDREIVLVSNDVVDLEQIILHEMNGSVVTVVRHDLQNLNEKNEQNDEKLVKHHGRLHRFGGLKKSGKLFQHKSKFKVFMTRSAPMFSHHFEYSGDDEDEKGRRHVCLPNDAATGGDDDHHSDA